MKAIALCLLLLAGCNQLADANVQNRLLIDVFGPKKEPPKPAERP